ncbi:MAG: hypothetical protein ACMUHY_07060, partial [Thermoplasmatota archaeon]
FVTVALINGTASGYSDRNIMKGRVYTYRLLARNDAGTSDHSREVQVDIASSSSSGLSAGGLVFMVIGTSVPLLIAAALLLFILRRKDGGTPSGETMPGEREQAPEPGIQQDVVSSPLSAGPDQNLQVPGIDEPEGPAPVPESYQEGSDLSFTDEAAPVVEGEVPLQEEPFPFMDRPDEGTIPENDIISREVIP